MYSRKHSRLIISFKKNIFTVDQWDPPMNFRKLRYILDVIPLAIIVVLESIFLFEVIDQEYGFQWQHKVALVLLPINIGLFFWHHQVAVLSLGITLILGLLGFLAVTHSISIRTISVGRVPIFYGQPNFWLFFLIHLVVSGRYYFAIATRKYWQILFGNLKSGNQRSN